MNKHQTFRIIAICALSIVEASTLSAMTADDIDKETAALKAANQKKINERREKLKLLSEGYDRSSDQLNAAIKKLQDQKKQTMQEAERMLDTTENEYEEAIGSLLRLKNKTKSLSAKNLEELNHLLNAVENGAMTLTQLKSMINKLEEAFNY